MCLGDNIGPIQPSKEIEHGFVILARKLRVRGRQPGIEVHLAEIDGVTILRKSDTVAEVPSVELLRPGDLRTHEVDSGGIVIRPVHETNQFEHGGYLAVDQDPANN